MDLDSINTIRQGTARYAPPHKRHQPTQDPKAGLSLDKATKFCGRPLNEVLKAKWGETCHYCKQSGHWYNNCAAYWDDV